MQLRGTEIVEKKNVLNEIRQNNMTLQELRFFSIYLSKINSRDISTRKVRFKLEDFKKIMGIGKVTISHFKDITNRLLGKVVNIPREDGKPGYIAFQLFKECEVYQSEEDDNQWYVEIDAHDRALPLMFDLKQNYFRYKVWNALRLKSKNQLRIYELLKQYEKIGVREIQLGQLKDWLGLDVNEYPRWQSFKIRVLDECKIALKKYTDIQFEYEMIKTSRRVTGVRFIINKNRDYQDKIKLSELLCNMCIDESQHATRITKIQHTKPEIKSNNIKPMGTTVGKNLKKNISDNNFDKFNSAFEEIDNSNQFLKSEESYDEFIEFLSGACDYEFSKNKMIVIKDLLVKAGYYSKADPTGALEAYDYLLGKYHELNSKENISRGDIERRFGLLKWLIKKDI